MQPKTKQNQKKKKNKKRKRENHHTATGGDISVAKENIQAQNRVP